MWHASHVSAGKLALLVGAVALVVVLVLGVSQATKETAAPPKATTLTAGEIRQRLDGAPPALAARQRGGLRRCRGLLRRLGDAEDDDHDERDGADAECELSG